MRAGLTWQVSFLVGKTSASTENTNNSQTSKSKKAQVRNLKDTCRSIRTEKRLKAFFTVSTVSQGQKRLWRAALWSGWSEMWAN